MTSALYYAAEGKLSPRARDILRVARKLAYGAEEVDFIESEPGVGALNFGFFPDLPEDAVNTLGFDEIPHVPRAELIVAAAMMRYQFKPLRRGPIENDAKTLYLDIESHSVDDMWRMPLDEYFRMGQWAWGIEGDVSLTTDPYEVIELIYQAECTIAHFAHNFDLSVMLGDEALHLAMKGMIFDPKVFANLTFPAPAWYRNRKGQVRKNASEPENAKNGWLSLDNLAYKFGVPGKEGDLSALANEFGGYGEIPTDDPRYTAYAVQDVRSLQGITGSMLQFAKPDAYDWREQKWAGLQAQMTRNGFAVNKRAAEHRQRTLETRKKELLAELEKDYGFPTEGKKPWMSKAGRAAIMSLLVNNGVNPEEDPDWPLTKTGNISLSGDALISGTQGTDLEETGRRLAELAGQRTLAELTLTHLQPDGMVHPEINALQRSGRSSVTKPGLTVFDTKEKGYYVARPGYKLVSFDYSAADARAVAAMSGDEEYAKRFAPGSDSHQLTGYASFGKEVYESDPVMYRTASKPISHGTNYNIGAKKLQAAIKRTTGLDFTVDQCQAMLNNFGKTYSKVTKWKTKVAEQGKSGWVTNLWGRTMPVERHRAFTQTSGLLGQSTTREVIVDGVIRMYEHDPALVTYVKCPVHDELIFELPEDGIEETIQTITELMAGVVEGIDFPVASGDPADTWQEATHA